MKRTFWWLFTLIITATLPATMLAQDCTFDVNAVLDNISLACGDLNRNEVCYGNTFVSAVPAEGAEALPFTVVGDRVDLAEVEQILLMPFDQGTEIWGAAMLMAQAQLENTLPGQLVPIVLFGNVDFRNDGFTRSGVQAFTFQTGIGLPTCQGVPPDGIMIRTPEGAGQLTLNMNGVDVTLGSTGFFQADATGTMTISMLEGTATALGVTASQGQALIVDTTTNQTLVQPYDPLTVVNVLPVFVWTNTLMEPSTGASAPSNPSTGGNPVTIIVTATPSSTEPCTISTDRRDYAALRVGPGTNRTNRTWLQPGRIVTVTGESDDGLWWQLDKFEATTQEIAYSVVELWVAKDQVTASGNCDAVGIEAAPPVIAPQPSAAPITPTATTPASIIVTVPPPSQTIAVIGSFFADSTSLTKSPNENQACTTVRWNGVDGGPGASILLSVGGSTNGVTGPSGSQHVCLSQDTTVTLQLIAPNATNGSQTRSLFISVTTSGGGSFTIK